MSEKRRQMQEVESLLKSHEPALNYDLERALARHHQLVAQHAAAPEFGSHVPLPKPPVWLGGKLVAWLSGSALLAGALYLILPAPTPHRPLATVSVQQVQASERRAADTQHEASTKHASRQAESRTTPAPTPAAYTAEPSSTAQDADPQAPALASASETNTPRMASVRAARGDRRARAEKTPADSKREPSKPLSRSEMQQVATAERLLDVDPAESLRLVRDCDQRFTPGYFVQERRYIEVIALAKLTRNAEALAKARAFFVDYAESAYRRRIERALGLSSPR